MKLSNAAADRFWNPVSREYAYLANTSSAGRDCCLCLSIGFQEL
jgi:hypothetical protein